VLRRSSVTPWSFEVKVVMNLALQQIGWHCRTVKCMQSMRIHTEIKATVDTGSVVFVAMVHEHELVEHVCVVCVEMRRARA
jgi:hypothetical protein